MKKTNKGFSMVELIIVIAIMAILAGALAPALIKYINKSRISTDISNGQQIASGIQNALSNEDAFDDASACTGEPYNDFLSSQGNSMQSEVKSILGDIKGTAKAKKDAGGSSITSPSYFVTFDPTSNVVTVYAGVADTNHMVYPSTGSSWVVK